MMGTVRLDARRLFARVFVVGLVLTLLPLAGMASAQEDEDDEITEYEGVGGQVIDSPADAEAELIASTRFRGEQRFATAALIALDTWDQSDRAVIARHDDWPDALAGGYLAGIFGAPVLLVSQDELQDDTLQALETLDVSEVTLLGGTAAISAESQTALEDLGYGVERVGGATRFETAALIAAEGDAIGEIDEEATAVVATGLEFADALTTGPLAYSQNLPILLTETDTLHPSSAQALENLGIERVLVPGGTNAVSDEVVEEIRDVIGGDEDSVTRLSGETRVETAAEVAVFAINTFGFSPAEHGWARGNEFADALTIGPRLGELNGPLLLVPAPDVADSGAGTNAALADQVACLTERIDVAGGFAAVTESVEDTLRSLLACPDEALQLSLEAGGDLVNQWVDVTATVRSNTGAPVEGGEVEFSIAETVPDDADAELRTGEGDPPSTDPVTATTDADGMATVQVRSQTPSSVVTVLAQHTRDDAVVIDDTVDVGFTPAPGDFTVDALDLSSANEVGDGTAVDAETEFTGTAWVNLDVDDGLVCWVLEVDDPGEADTGSFEAWAADAGRPGSHIHDGDAGENGPIVVDLGTISDEDLTSTGCRLVELDLQTILDAPEGFYVNIHTDLYPGGIVRGQMPALP